MSDRFGMTGNYLIHSAKGTSWEKKDHKYVSKKQVNGKWAYVYNKKNSLEKTLQEKTGENIIKRDIEAINILSNSQDEDAKKAIAVFEKDMKVAELMANGKITKIPKTEDLEEAMYYLNKYKKQKEKRNGNKEN